MKVRSEKLKKQTKRINHFQGWWQISDIEERKRRRGGEALK